MAVDRRDFGLEFEVFLELSRESPGIAQKRVQDGDRRPDACSEFDAADTLCNCRPTRRWT